MKNAKVEVLEGKLKGTQKTFALDKLKKRQAPTSFSPPAAPEADSDTGEGSGAQQPPEPSPSKRPRVEDETDPQHMVRHRWGPEAFALP